MQAITEVHDVGGYISSPAPLIKLQHSICCFLIYSFGDNIMQKTIGMSFFVNHMYFYLTYALKNLHVHLLYSSVMALYISVVNQDPLLATKTDFLPFRKKYKKIRIKN